MENKDKVMTDEEIRNLALKSLGLDKEEKQRPSESGEAETPISPSKLESEGQKPESKEVASVEATPKEEGASPEEEIEKETTGKGEKGVAKEEKEPLQKFTRTINGREWTIEVYADGRVKAISADGRERELTLDELASKGIAADEKFEDAAALRKQIKEEREQLQREKETLVELKAQLVEAATLDAIKEVAKLVDFPTEAFESISAELDEALDDEERHAILDKAKRMVLNHFKQRHEKLTAKEAAIRMKEAQMVVQEQMRSFKQDFGDFGDVLYMGVILPIAQVAQLPKEQRPEQFRDLPDPTSPQFKEVLDAMKGEIKKRLDTYIAAKWTPESENEAMEMAKRILEKHPKIKEKLIGREVKAQLEKLKKKPAPKMASRGSEGEGGKPSSLTELAHFILKRRGLIGGE